MYGRLLRFPPYPLLSHSLPARAGPHFSRLCLLSCVYCSRSKYNLVSQREPRREGVRWGSWWRPDIDPAGLSYSPKLLSLFTAYGMCPETALISCGEHLCLHACCVCHVSLPLIARSLSSVHLKYVLVCRASCYHCWASRRAESSLGT